MRTLHDAKLDLAAWDDLDVQSELYKQALSLPNRLLADHCRWQSDRWLMKFPNGLEDFLMSLERSQRSKLRRKYKKVLAHFDQRLEIRTVNSVEELERAIPDFEEIAAKTEKRKLGFGFFDTLEIGQELTQAAENGWLRAFVVYLEGKPAAFWIGTLYNRCLQADYVGYDPVWSEYSPGIFLFLSVLNMLQSEDIETIDFGRGDTQLRQCFSDLKKVEARVRIHAPSLRGLWLNLARTATFKATMLFRRTNGLSFSKTFSEPFRNGAKNAFSKTSTSRAEEYLSAGELEHVSSSL
jgi:CelD/BcsL family acetyltransferase involved in cellulose biosynthesis